MGGYISSIGNFHLSIHDSVHDYIKDKQPKEYYENYMVDGKFTQYLDGWKEPKYSWMSRERNKNEWDIQIPLLKLGKIHKLKKYYRFKWEGNLRKLLWEEIHKRGFVVEGYVAIRDFYTDENGENIWKYYYLTSNIGEQPVKLQSPTEDIDVLHQVYNEDEHKWIIKQGLGFYTKIKGE